MYDAIIIGAGVTGCAVARELSRYAGNFLVVERGEDVCVGASKANSAIVHAGFDARPGSLAARLNVEGSKMMPGLARELDFPFRQNGSLVLCFSEGGRGRLEALLERGRANGVAGLRILSQGELRALEPAVSPEAVGALYAPTGGIVCPFKLTLALAENAWDNGAAFRFNTAVRSLREEGAGFAVDGGGAELRARAVVNAAGVNGDLLHNALCPQDPVAIRPRRGEYVLLDKRAGGLVRHTVFQLPGEMGKGVLVTPTVHGNLLVGPTAQDTEDRAGTDTTAAGLAMAMERGRRSVPGLPFQEAVTSFAGLRAHALPPAADFILGEARPGYFDAIGIESPGLTAAPAIGRYVAGLVAKRLGLTLKGDFNPRRRDILNPQTLPLEERRALIQENPAYGNILCRCEQVSEGEILEAIRRPLGARSLDGVKRRVRAGMGRCQGGFCAPRVAALLARELDIPLERVTKCGGGSYLLAGRK